MLWFVDSAVSSGVTADDAEGAFDDAEGDSVFEDGLAAVFGAGGEEGAETGGVEVLHRAMIEGESALIENDRHRCDLANDDTCCHKSLAR